MILPNKYITLTESFIGISGLILELLSNKCLTIEILWDSFKKKYIKKNNLNNPPTYQKFIYTLEFMYLCGMINYTEKGEIFNENFKSKD